MARYEVEFSVDLLVGKQRPRFSRATGRTYTPKETQQAEEMIAIAYKGASIRAYGRVVSAPQYVPVTLTVECRPRWTPSWRRTLPEWLRDVMPFTKTPDWDNVGKTVSDGLNGVAYHDDAQVTDARVVKNAMEKGKGDRVDVVVSFESKD